MTEADVYTALQAARTYLRLEAELKEFCAKVHAAPLHLVPARERDAQAANQRVVDHIANMQATAKAIGALRTTGRKV